MRACLSGILKERERECVCVCVCVCARAHVCVCDGVYVCVHSCGQVFGSTQEKEKCKGLLLDVSMCESLNIGECLCMAIGGVSKGCVFEGRAGGSTKNFLEQ